MEEKQKRIILPQQEQPAQKEDGYTWSPIRVAEGIAINVGSAIAIAILTALVAFLPSIVLLLVQHIFSFLLISANWLAIIAYVSGAVLFVLIIGIGLLYLFMKKHPTVLLFMLFGALIGLHIETNPPDFSKFKFEFTPPFASQKQNDPSNTQSK